MSEPYVILSGVSHLMAQHRALTERAGPSGGTRAGGATKKPEIHLSTAELEPREVAELRRDPDSMLALAMPVVLCHPMAASSELTGTAWGVSAVGASTSPCDGSGVTVAVLDTGIERKHSAFSAIADITEQDFTGEGNGDKHGHGTHCASTVFGRDVNNTRVGVARGVSRVLIGKVLCEDGRGDTPWLFRALNWALDQGTQVISMSLGFDFPGMVAQLHDSGWPVDAATSHALGAYRSSLRVFDAFMKLVEVNIPWNGGTVVVAATGNESRPGYKIGAALPAAAEGVVSVAAATPPGANGHGIAEFSNRWPVLSAPGVNILGADRSGALVHRSGTSMAAPHVAGVAALWWQKKRMGMKVATATAVTAALRDTSRRDVFAADVDDVDCGTGLVRAPA